MKLRQSKDKRKITAKEGTTTLTVVLCQTIGKAVKVTKVNAVNQMYIYRANSSINSISVGGNFSETVATFPPDAIKIEAQVTVSFLLN